MYSLIIIHQSSLFQLPSEDKDDETVCTFVLRDEDHTLGNSLRYMIMKKYVISLYRDRIAFPVA